ncbi:hypothetical protein XFLM_10255 [Xylella fastidiosa subsp. fastidiosa GB514]|nr:hypothetical protein XFLM_10255 [Xylella fastidiosa subsp. fastidiosa GB514]
MRSEGKREKEKEKKKNALIKGIQKKLNSLKNIQAIQTAT